MAPETKTKPKKAAAPKRVRQTAPAKEKPVKKRIAKKETPTAPEPKAEAELKGKFIYAVGRRKEATAKVRLFQGASVITINEKPVANYFPVFEFQQAVLNPIKVAGLEGKVGVSVMVDGGGIRGQAEAIRLAISRALLKLEPSLRPSLKARGFLKRDPRVKERRKYGLKKARKAPQWAKR